MLDDGILGRVMRDVFGDEIDGAQLQSLEGMGGAHRRQIADHDHRQRMAVHDLAQALQAVHVGHRHIQRDHIRIQPLDLLQRVLPVVSGSDHFQFGVFPQHSTDYLTH